MYTTCLSLRLTSSSNSHCRDIPGPFSASVYTATDYPALLSLSPSVLPSMQWTALGLSLCLPPPSVSPLSIYIYIYTSCSLCFITVNSKMASFSLLVQDWGPRGLLHSISCQDPLYNNRAWTIGQHNESLHMTSSLLPHLKDNKC